MEFRQAEWTRVRRGRSGAELFRRGDLYAKRGDVAAETARLTWLHNRLPVPRIVSATDGLLITAALPGVPGDELPETRQQMILLQALASLRTLPIAECPFTASVAQLIDTAAARVASGLVDEDDFDPVRRGRTARSLLDELHRTRPMGEEPVVCHGDLCADNLIVDGDAIAFIDVGQLAVTDRHRDLALIARAFPSLALPDVDPARLVWFQLLDEL